MDLNKAQNEEKELKEGQKFGDQNALYIGCHVYTLAHGKPLSASQNGILGSIILDPCQNMAMRFKQHEQST